VTGVVAAASAVFGLVIGSFLNVVIHRVPRKESVVSPRSRCPTCENELMARDNVPLLSWLLLRGKCRHCSAPISARYPLVELLTAVAFAAIGARFGADWALPSYLIFTAALVAVGFIDIEHYIVPNRILIATLAVGGPLLVMAAALDDRWLDLRRALIGAVAASGGLLVMNLVNPRWMGMGDVKLAFPLGLWLGWLSVGHVLAGLFVGFLLGSIGGLTLIATGLRTRKDHIPFAPFLGAGAFVVVLAGRQLLDWYGVGG
jgi:leader peptidase (prepilin peptidase)/N-methyltransferase